MYDAIQNPPKGKKEKDVGKRRAYVRVVTSLGGSLNLELYCEKVDSPVIWENAPANPWNQAPKTCYNWLMLARQGKYNDVIFHRIIPNFMVCILSVASTHLTGHSRRKLATPLVLGPVGSHTGEHLSETSMIIKVHQSTIQEGQLFYGYESRARIE